MLHPLGILLYNPDQYYHDIFFSKSGARISGALLYTRIVGQVQPLITKTAIDPTNFPARSNCDQQETADAPNTACSVFYSRKKPNNTAKFAESTCQQQQQQLASVRQTECNKNRGEKSIAAHLQDTYTLPQYITIPLPPA